VRESLALRIIEHQQVDHVKILFSYIKQLFGYDDSGEQVRVLLDQLRSWPPHADYLKQLFDCYLEDSYALPDTRGLIMRNLTEKGEMLAVPLGHLYQEEADKREAILKLLSHMVSYGQIPALHELFKICAGPTPRDAIEKLKHGLRKLSSKSDNYGVADSLWLAIEEHRDVNPLLVSDIEQTREAITLSSEDIQKLLSGSKEGIWKLRHVVPSPFEELRRSAYSAAAERSNSQGW
jgi:hypothetical protein